MPAADKNVRPTKTGLPDENSLHHKAGPAHEMSLLHKESLAHKRRRPCSRGEEGQGPATGTGLPVWQAYRLAPPCGGGLRWSAQWCGPDGVGTPVPFGIVSLCRRDRRHGKPGGMLHKGAGVARRTARSTERPAWRSWRRVLQGADTLVRPYKALH